ncbi:hypothetical protein [Hyphococcus luteus]|uniref:hypothetical protein n=1 Tax=Hyphococcus luteus TaxID=2058213 RepID=UPI0013FD3001|nr:hypothetical protein [Marinicaulis flavus]
METKTQKILMIAGFVAVIIGGTYYINESSKSDTEKLGDSIENAADDVSDAIKDATN